MTRRLNQNNYNIVGTLEEASIVVVPFDLEELNLNDYAIVKQVEDASLIITPFEIDGKEQPLLYLRYKSDKKPLLYLQNKLGKKPVVKDTDEAVWFPTVEISKEGTPDEFCLRVNWWFDNISDEYRQQVKDIYRNLTDLSTHIKQAKGWLLTDAAYKVNRSGKYFKRKEDINKFLRGWLNRSFEKQVRRTNG